MFTLWSCPVIVSRTRLFQASSDCLIFQLAIGVCFQFSFFDECVDDGDEFSHGGDECSEFWTFGDECSDRRRSNAGDRSQNSGASLHDIIAFDNRFDSGFERLHLLFKQVDHFLDQVSHVFVVGAGELVLFPDDIRRELSSAGRNILSFCCVLLSGTAIPGCMRWANRAMT
jgi:hypothetical protein